jgi:acetyl/propionyl-CoA carboxylase alpha subunit
MYRKILIANRGEIACRIARTLRRMGVAVATVHSSADSEALHVREIGESVAIGGETARDSYLDIGRVIDAARECGADAVHPGFGFLSENAEFAWRCAEAGITFIGPKPESLTLFGDKAEAKQLARSLGIPVAEGTLEPSDDVEALVEATATLARPFVLKAVAGGGGKGMRVVQATTQVRSAIESAIREGRSAFGDGRLIAERYLARPRHIEVQILGDGRGNVIHLFDRECTLQRRYQKVVEEAPATSIPQKLREQLWCHAVALGRAANYLGLGTVEFAVTEQGAVFLEVNPRLQVEHPVTEAVTGLDLVQLQVETVASGRLPFAQAEVPTPNGVAVQARLYAEDAQRQFLPATGRIEFFDVPPSVRCDAGVSAGSLVTPHYDPMLAKLVAHGPARGDAIARLRSALAATTVLGVVTNRRFLAELLADARVQANEVSTEFIDAWLAARPEQAVPPRTIGALAAAWLAGRRRTANGAWGDAQLTGWRANRGPGQSPPLTWNATGPHATWRIGFGDRGSVQVEDMALRVGSPPRADGENHSVTIDGCAVQLRVLCSPHAVHGRVGDDELSLDMTPLHAADRSSSSSAHGTVRAPMMGIVIAVDAAHGQKVAAGDRLAVMESMKMEMAIHAPVDGVVAWVGCEARGKVERHQDLFRIESAA